MSMQDWEGTRPQQQREAVGLSVGLWREGPAGRGLALWPGVRSGDTAQSQAVPIRTSPTLQVTLSTGNCPGPFILCFNK